MRCAHNKKQTGFTLVEISIVMIIIGLLIGGTFAGMKLIENMQVNRTVQDLKAIESAALTFKDTYGRLPGDIVNPASRLPNCTAAPCAVGGNGDRSLDAALAYNAAITGTDERFTFWSHLQAANLLSMGTKNTTNMNYGEGQPDTPIGDGYRMSRLNGIWWAAGSPIFKESIVIITPESSALVGGLPSDIKCDMLMAIDKKMDDGMPLNGLFQGSRCTAAITISDPYVITNLGSGVYDLKGF